MRFVLLCVGMVVTPFYPAAAQFAPHPPVIPGMTHAAAVPGWGNGVGDVYDRIDDGRRAGRLSRHEARQMRREAALIDTLGERFGRDGLSDTEAQELAVRTAILRDQVDARRSGVAAHAG